MTESKDSEFQTNCIKLFNSLLHGGDSSIQDQLQIEFINLGVVEKMKEVTDKLNMNEDLGQQLDVFQGLISTVHHTGDLSKPDDRIKNIQNALPSKAQQKFLNILKFFLQLTNQDDDNVTVENWEAMEALIEQTVTDMDEKSRIKNRISSFSFNL
jgi:hypothetical protein